jgi:CheY-like chemotaxis protein
MSASAATILIVDDEEHLRDIIAYDLKKAGYATVQAENGKRAMERLEAGGIDLVLSDVRMPGGGGLQLLERVRAHHYAAPPFLFMTAYADLSAEEALGLGARSFLRKPVEKEELLAEVREGLLPIAKRWEASPAEFPAVLPLEAFEPLADVVGRDPVAVEVGHAGMFFPKTGDFPTTFSFVSFDFESADPALGRVCGVGRVRWARHEASGSLPPGVGIEFVALDAPMRARLAAYLDRARPRAYVPLGPQERSRT